jgi:hypothetical protein
MERRDDAESYLEVALETWAARSWHQWTLDISVLGTRYGLDRLREMNDR